MMVDPLPAALHIQSIQRQHSEAKPKYTLTSGRTYHQEGAAGDVDMLRHAALLCPNIGGRLNPKMFTP